MAQSRTVRIETKKPVRYTTEVVGNTVRVAQEAPKTREKEREKRVHQVHEARERALRMNLRYVIFLSAAAVATVTICIYYLNLQATSTQLQKQTASLQKQLKDLQLENDIVHNEIISGVDLEHVREVAVNELGMSYPTERQIVTYTAAPSDYVKQYEEIPE